jgi:hypothetical protein
MRSIRELLGGVPSAPLGASLVWLLIVVSVCVVAG